MLNDEEIALLKRCNPIGAIQSLRSRTPGLGLKEAKALCDAAVPVAERVLHMPYSLGYENLPKAEPMDYAPATYAGGREDMKEDVLCMLKSEAYASTDIKLSMQLQHLIKRVEKLS